MNGQGQKDTIYIDIDDEITAVIEKLRGSPHKIVALVLPKRAGVFQSVVNMKLLKRTAEHSKKHVVLITSEEALLPLAGAVGLHVAHSLQSKPEIPPGPKDTPTGPDGELPLDKTTPIGQLAGQNDESIEVNHKADTPETPGKAKKSKPSKSGGDKKKKIKIPNFEKFRNRFLLGGIAAVVLIVGLVLGLFVLPKASVTLKTDSSRLDTNITFTADTNAKLFDKENNMLPAINKEFRRTDTERVAATGQVDKGNKSSGSMVLTNCSESDGAVTIPAGTGISSGNLTYITQQAVNLEATKLSGGSKQCVTPSQTVSVTAEKPGTQYNIESGKDFAVSGYSGVKAKNNSPMGGGTSDVKKVISPSDIEKGKQTIQNRANNTAHDDLEEEIKDEGYYPIKESLVASDPTVTTDRNANDEADAVTVTSTTVYTMVGVKEGDLKKIIEAEADKRMDTQKQSILNNGLSKATFKVQGTQDSQTKLSLQTAVVVGPKLDNEAIKEQIAGKGRTETEDILKQWPDISDVEVKYSPFWVGSTPKSTKKINIIFEDAGN